MNVFHSACFLPVPAGGLIALRYRLLLYLNTVTGQVNETENGFLRPVSYFGDP